MASVTEQILSAWDDDDDDETSEGAVVEQPVEEQPEEVVGEEQPEEDEQDGEEPEEQEGQEEDEEEEVVEEESEGEEEEDDVLAEYSDPEIRAYLSKYQNDPERALKAAVNLQRVLGRQGQEKAVLTRRVQELEAQMVEQQAFQTGALLSPEQQQWVGEATESGNPGMFVQQAVQAGEYELARAVCAEWARESPYEALRVSQAVDGAEQRAYQQQYQQIEEEPVDHGLLLDTLVSNFPEMPIYETQMISTLNNLGPAHPLVQDAQSNDLRTAAKAIINIYEIARAQTVSTKNTRDQVRAKTKTDAAEARRRAVVSSSNAQPNPSEAPRARTIMPGLTLEQLEAEWEND